MNSVFDRMQTEFNGRVRFIKLDWNSKAGEDAAKEYIVETAPTSVLIDSKGRVVEKIEGKVDVSTMRAKLKTMIEAPKK